MTYEEPKDPLTGKAERHATASLLSTLGLRRAVIIEPEIYKEPEIVLKYGMLLLNKKHPDWGVHRITKEPTSKTEYYEITGDRGSRVMFKEELPAWEIIKGDDLHKATELANGVTELNSEIVIHRDSFNVEEKFLNMGLVNGRNLLSRAGFIKQPNPLFMKKGDEYWHYNKLMGKWLYEDVSVKSKEAEVKFPAWMA